MYTSVMLIALSGCLTHVGSVPSSSPWHTDYQVAWNRGHAERKPMAMLFGSGPGGWQKLSKEGEMGKNVKNLLGGNYVCVYIDTSKPAGDRLAKAYEIPGGLGIVLSDRTGDLQAFRHEGDLANGDLERYLRKYADPERVVRVTDSNPGEAPVYQPAPSAPVQVPSYYPPVQGGMFYRPSFMPFRAAACRG